MCSISEQDGACKERRGEGKNGEREWTRKREEPERRIVCLFQKAEFEKVLALKTFMVTSV